MIELLAFAKSPSSHTGLPIIRYHTLSFVIVAALVFSGCNRSTAPTPTASTQIMTLPGTNHDPVTGWTVRVSETDGIHLDPPTSGLFVKFKTTIHPPNWKPHPGWFVFAENEERVWMFDGEHGVLMLNATPTNWSINGEPLRNYPVPAAVAARLPESLRQEIENK